MTERVGPEEPEERIVLVGGREVQRVLVDEIRVVLEAEAKLQRAFVFNLQILFRRHGERAIVVSSRLAEKPELVVIERADLGLVFRIARDESAVLEMLPHERAFVELPNLFRIACPVSVRLIEAG